MISLIEKIWKYIMGIPPNTEVETFCQKLKREKLEEEMRVQAAEKKAGVLQIVQENVYHNYRVQRLTKLT